MNLYILHISPRKKKMFIVRSERLLKNLSLFSPVAFDELLRIYPEYEIYEMDEKLYDEAEDKKNNQS
jgi:hypothetical protein